VSGRIHDRSPSAPNPSRRTTSISSSLSPPLASDGEAPHPRAAVRPHLEPKTERLLALVRTERLLALVRPCAPTSNRRRRGSLPPCGPAPTHASPFQGLPPRESTAQVDLRHPCRSKGEVGDEPDAGVGKNWRSLKGTYGVVFDGHKVGSSPTSTFLRRRSAVAP
jgi:hypothetical protein